MRAGVSVPTSPHCSYNKATTSRAQDRYHLHERWRSQLALHPPDIHFDPNNNTQLEAISQHSEVGPVKLHLFQWITSVAWASCRDLTVASCWEANFPEQCPVLLQQHPKLSHVLLDTDYIHVKYCRSDKPQKFNLHNSNYRSLNVSVSIGENIPKQAA